MSGVTYDFVSKTVIHDFHTPAIAGTMTIDLKGHVNFFPMFDDWSEHVKANLHDPYIWR